jgi:dihydroorotate dehydrogenase (fumarate)/dihydroorotate dehydrogenase
MKLYRPLLRPLLFRADAESVHGLAIRAAELASSSHWLCSSIARRNVAGSDRLAVEIGGLRFRTPLGLAAGFDKSARAVPFLAALGFGHVEVGSISAEPSAGNPKPRLFRIPQDRGIVVNYGLPNDGADRVARRLAGLRACAPLGINIVSTNRGHWADVQSDEEVIGDYLQSVRRLQPVADYLCLNLSCPNTREGRGFFHEPARLAQLLHGLDSLDGRGVTKPLFLKVAPFQSPGDLEAFLAAVEPARLVTGFSVNLPPGKPSGLRTPASELSAMPGAVSGPAAGVAADRTLRELYRRMDRSRYHLIGSGGVFTAEDAYRKIRLGASLVQLMTALVYEGPGVAARINRGLALLLEADGVRHVSEAVGADVR